MSDNAAAKTFQDFYLSDELLRALEAIDYVTPTPVQSATIPLIMAGIDLIVQSQTGTGKTAAFGIPAIEMLEPDPGRIEMLVLAPTRELARQVSEEFGRINQFKELSSTAIYGGAPYGPQVEALQTAQIVCATPGRLLDLLQQKKLTLEHLRFFTLDEADEMLSMGFERELSAIVEFLPEERQSLLFSATVTEDVKSLARNMLFYPEYLSFSSDSVVNEDVTHSYIRVESVARMRDLIKVLEYEEPENAIVFANTKHDTFLVSNFLKRHGYRAEVLNGDLPQSEREKTLGDLRAGKIDYLVATDVAARGIDISDLSHVINYVLPDTPDVYVHRTGRTGRAGRKGKAISLLSPAEMNIFLQIKKHCDVELIEEPMPTTADIIRVKRGRETDHFTGRLERFDALPHEGKQRLAGKLLAELEEGEEASTELLAKLIALADWALARDGSLRVSPGAVAPVTPAAPTRAPEDTPRAEPQAQATPDEQEAPSRREPTQKKAKPPSSSSKPSSSQDEDDEGRRAARGGSIEPVQLDEDAPAEDSPSGDQDQRPRKARGRGARRRGGDAIDEGGSRRQSSRRDDSRRDRSGRGKKSGQSERSSSSRGSSRDSKPTQDAGEETIRPTAATSSGSSSHDMTKMWMNIGRNVFDSSGDALEFVVYMSGMDETDFGQIQLERSYAFVEVRDDYLEDVIHAIDSLDYEGNRISASIARKQ